MTTKHTPRLLHMSQACGCGIDLHGHSWDYVLDRGKDYTFTYCALHALAPEMAEALHRVLDLYREGFQLGAIAWEDSMHECRALLARLAT